MTPEQRPALTDLAVLTLYERWSEWEYAASFMDPSPVVVRAFRAWLVDQWRDRDEPYELAMLAEFRRQEEG